MSFSAFCPIVSLGTVRQLLDEQGFGPENFVVPLREGAEAATHAGMHAWGPESFKQAIADLPVELGVTIHDDACTATESFTEMVTTATLEWSDPLDESNPWFVNPVMTDDERTYGGKTWISLMDYNVWTPPVGWREVVAEGQRPDWVQPTGAHDVWNLNDEVNHDDKQWRSLIANNVWEPGSVGSSLLWEDITVAEPPVDEWPQWVQPQGAHDAYRLGAKVTYQGVRYINTGSDANVWSPLVYGWSVQP